MVLRPGLLPNHRLYLRLFAGPGPPYSATAEDESSSSVYVDTHIIILAAVSLLLSLLAATGICFCFHKSTRVLRNSELAEALNENRIPGPEREDICLRESQSTAALDNKHSIEHREKYYTSVRKQSESPCRDIGALERIPEHAEDIYPYATFHLPEHESMAGNPQRQSYIYENQVRRLAFVLKNSSPKRWHSQDSESYGKSRRGNVRRKSKTHKSESEEYDSLGSDSEIEQGLTLRAESVNHLCESQPARYPRGDSTLGRQRKEVEDPDSRYIARFALQSRTPHHGKRAVSPSLLWNSDGSRVAGLSIHNDDTYVSDRHAKKRSGKSRSIYESNINSRMGMMMLPT